MPVKGGGRVAFPNKSENVVSILTVSLLEECHV